MKIESKLEKSLTETITKLYGQCPTLLIQPTKKEFIGDFTLVCFGLTQVSKKNPQETAEEIGEALQQADAEVEAFNIVKGFLNIRLVSRVWLEQLKDFDPYDKPEGSSGKVMIEYSSPNTNKPLHLGHIRNNLLGYSASRILQAAGKEVVKVNLINDRGIHICKSMIAWQKAGLNETPESTGIKGDHLVGKYYVEFDKILKSQAAPLLSLVEERGEAAASSMNLDEKSDRKFSELMARAAKPEGRDELKDFVNNQTEIMKEAKEMLLKWEQGDAGTLALWKKMNGWVYDGFKQTYAKMGVEFDKFYYESETYILGKELVDEGLTKGVLYRKDDGSAWIDLTADGLDQKLLLRSDGTSVYMTQDLGTAQVRNEELHADSYVYVVGNEQEYHFKVLKLILQKMGFKWADGIYHLSYGMVDLPSGKMKSREGTVVDADDLMEEIVAEAKSRAIEAGKTAEMPDEEREQLYVTVGMAALKYYILKVDPKKRMVFNPSESIDLNGNTGPFIQYTYARIRSVERKAEGVLTGDFDENELKEDEAERILIKLLSRFTETIVDSAKSFNPSLVANYAYDLAKEYNQFYHDHPVIKEENKAIADFRFYLSLKVAETLKYALFLLGITVPERM